MIIFLQMIQCFADHPGQPLENPKDDGGRKKKGGGKTVSSYFKGQLDDLMGTLYKTEPHFIRCVVPNTHKEPGGVSNTDATDSGGRCVTYMFSLRWRAVW